jgi:cold shock CspA family protein
MAWELFMDDCFCRISNIPSGGYKLLIIDQRKGENERIMLPLGTSLDAAKEMANHKIVEISRPIDDSQKKRFNGSVRWYDGFLGYGFIELSPETVSMTGMATKKDRNVHVHWSSILMDGNRMLYAGDPVEFELRKGDRGWYCTYVIKTDSLDSNNFRELIQLRRDRIAVVMIDGTFKLIRVSPDRQLHYLDSQDRFHGLLYLPQTRFGVYNDVIDELESLINQSNVREDALHDFFERYPEFIMSDEYTAAHSKITLESDTSDLLIPDFILEPVGQNKLCDLLELKLPAARVEVHQDRRERFAASVLEACAQLRTYRDYFEDKNNRDRFRTKYGLEAFRPKMYVIIGRRGAIEPIEWRRIEDDLPMLNVKTYDDVLERAKHILDRFGTLQRRS